MTDSDSPSKPLSRHSLSFSNTKDSLKLFSIHKLLSIGSKTQDDEIEDTHDEYLDSETFLSFSVVKGNDVNITCCAQGGAKDHEYFAMFCSNGHLIFRYKGSSDIPVVRHFKWFKEPELSIVGISFVSSGQWCMCVTQNLTIYLLPIYFIMVKQNISFFDSMKVIKSISRGHDYRGFVHCMCIRSSKGFDYGVIATKSGSIRFVHLKNEEVIRIQKNIQITHFDLLNSSDGSKLLIIHTSHHGYCKLAIENNYESIFDSKDRGKSQFSIQTIQKFSKSESKLYVQNTDKGSLIGYFDSYSNEYEVFDDQFSVYPLFNYRLGNNEINHVHMTDKVLFTIGKDEYYVNKISVVSKLLAEAKSKGSPVLQELSIDYDEPILGTFPDFNSFQRHIKGLRIHDDSNRQYHRYDSNEDDYSSTDRSQTPDLLQSSNNDEDNENEEDHPIIHDKVNLDVENQKLSDPLEGFYFWSNKTLYQVKPNLPLEQIFFKLVEKGMEKKLGENLVLTFDLDVYNLYEVAGDNYFKKGQHGRALDLYYLSNISKGKLVQKYIEVGRVDVIIPIMRVYLAKPQGMSEYERKNISNQLLNCYIYRILSKGTTQHSDNELEIFLRTNDAYDAMMALKRFKYFGLLNYFFITAQSRNIIEKSFQILTEKSGITYLPSEQVKELSKGYFTLFSKYL